MTQQLPALTHLLGRDDVPRKEHRLPRPLTPEQDQLIQQELLRRNDLVSNVLLLLRHTGMRIGECVDLRCVPQTLRGKTTNRESQKRAGWESGLMDARSRTMLMRALRILESRNNPLKKLTTAEIELLTSTVGESAADFTTEELAWFVIWREIDQEWPCAGASLNQPNIKNASA